MNAQLNLFDERTRGVPAGRCAARMIAILVKRGGGWLKRADFAEYGLTDRQCRAGREAAHGRIICGQRGFKLTRNASGEEVAECLAFLASSIRAFQEDYRLVSRRAHRQLHNAGGDAHGNR